GEDAASSFDSSHGGKCPQFPGCTAGSGTGTVQAVPGAVVSLFCRRISVTILYQKTNEWNRRPAPGNGAGRFLHNIRQLAQVVDDVVNAEICRGGKLARIEPATGK